MKAISTFELDKSKYPSLGFRFMVTFNNVGSSGKNIYCSFQSISGLTKTNKSSKISSGGDSTREYKLPTHNSYKDVILKRGILDDNKDLLRWIENLGVDPNTGRLSTSIVLISLYDIVKGKIKKTETWTLSDCYPTSMQLGVFDAQKNAVALETIHLTYSKYERESVSGLANYF